MLSGLESGQAGRQADRQTSSDPRAQESEIAVSEEVNIKKRVEGVKQEENKKMDEIQLTPYGTHAGD